MFVQVCLDRTTAAFQLIHRCVQSFATRAIAKRTSTQLTLYHYYVPAMLTVLILHALLRAWFAI